MRQCYKEDCTFVRWAAMRPRNATEDMGRVTVHPSLRKAMTSPVCICVQGDMVASSTDLHSEMNILIGPVQVIENGGTAGEIITRVLEPAEGLLGCPGGRRIALRRCDRTRLRSLCTMTAAIVLTFPEVFTGLRTLL